MYCPENRPADCPVTAELRRAAGLQDRPLARAAECGTHEGTSGNSGPAGVTDQGWELLKPCCFFVSSRVGVTLRANHTAHRIAKCNANSEERDGDRDAGCVGHSDTQAGSSVLYFESKHICTQKRTMGFLVRAGSEARQGGAGMAADGRWSAGAGPACGFHKPDRLGTPFKSSGLWSDGPLRACSVRVRS